MIARSRSARTALSALAVLTLLLASGVARADDEDAAAEAMRRGVAAYGQGDVTAALAAYEEAKRLAPKANVPFLYAAEALFRLERYEEAVTNLERYIAMNPDVSDAASVRTRIVTIRREHFPGRLRVESNVADARVSVDGAPRTETLPATFTLPAGKHTIVWTSEGNEPATEDVVVVGDADTNVKGMLTRTAPPPPPPVAPPPKDEGTSGEFPFRTAGWSTLGVGAATLGTAIVLDNTALHQKVQDAQTAQRSSAPNAIALKNDASGWQTGVAATYVIGGVLAAGGIALVLLAPRPSPSGTKASVRLVPQATATHGGSGGFQVLGTF